MIINLRDELINHGASPRVAANVVKILTETGQVDEDGLVDHVNIISLKACRLLRLRAFGKCAWQSIERLQIYYAEKLHYALPSQIRKSWRGLLGKTISALVYSEGVQKYRVVGFSCTGKQIILKDAEGNRLRRRRDSITITDVETNE